MLAFGGIFADRIDRRWLLFLSRVIVMALIIVIGTLTLLQLVSIWHAYAISFILGTIQGLSLPAQMAIVPDMVDDEYILSATSLNMAVFNGGRVLGPAVAGVIIEYAGIGQALYLNAACYAISGLFLLLMTGLRSRVESANANIIEDLAEGVRYVASTPIAFVLVGLGFAFGFFGSSYIQVLPAFGRETLNMNADGAASCSPWQAWDRWSVTCSSRRWATRSTRTGCCWA